MKIKNILIILCITLFSKLNIAQELVTKTKIDSLANEADAVILKDSNIITVTDKNTINVVYKRKILVKNKSALKYCTKVFVENEFISVDQISAKISDTLGTTIKELDDEDLLTAEISPGSSYYTSASRKGFKLNHYKYPFILEYKVLKEINSLFFWPPWVVQYDIPSLNSSYKIVLEEPLEIKFHKIGLTSDFEKYIEDGDSVYSWEVTNVPPKNDEEFIPPWEEYEYLVLFEPESFYMREYKGSFETWNSVAEWYRSLAADRYNLSQQTKGQIKNLVKNDISDLDKIKTLYKYLQKNYRYVAIELGISGWQPHSAQSVYDNKFGDCKDLSTLMVAMLDAVGIKSYPALVRTKKSGFIIKEFPSCQFNHVIAFVPLPEDTLLLECTATNISLEDTPYNITDIDILVVGDNSGELIRTKQKGSSANQWISTSKTELLPNGELKLKSSIYLTGNQENYFRSALNGAHNKEEKLFFKNRFGRYYPNMDIKNHNHMLIVEDSSKLNLNIVGKIKKFAKKSSKRMFINPNLYNRSTNEDLYSAKKRTSSIFYYYPYQDIDSVYIKLPVSYDIEAIPDSTNLSTSFASYKTEYKKLNNSLLYIRQFELKKNLIDQKFAEEYQEFIKKVIKADKSKFILTKTSSKT